MYDEQDRKWLYNELQSAGYKTGSYDEFKESLNNQEDRDWYYEESKKLGLEVGSADDFASMMVEPQKTSLVEKVQAAAESGTFPFVGSVGRQQGVSAENEKKPLWQMSAELGMQGRANREGAQRMESIKKGSALGNAFGGGKEPLTGKRYTESGEETNELGQWYDTQKNNQQRKAEAEYGETLKANIDNSRAANDEALAAIEEKERKSAPRGGGYGYAGMGAAMNQSLTGYHDPNKSLYIQANDVLEDAEDLIKAAEYSEKHNGWQEFWTGAGAKLKDWETWDMGISSLARSISAKKVIDKLEANDGDETKLTSGEKALLDAIATQAVVNQYYADRIGKGYKVGEGFAESIPFMAEMIINPMSGAGSAAGKAVGKYILKKYGVKSTLKGVAQSIMKKEGAKAVGKTALATAARATTAAGAQIGGAAGMTVTTGLAKMQADALQRQIGQVTGETGDDGAVHYTGRRNYEDNALKAEWKAFANTVIEYLSETGMGAANEIVGNTTGYVIGKLFKGKTAKALQRVTEWGNKVKKSKGGQAFGNVVKRGQYHGVFGEFMEEIEGGITNALVVGDQTLDTDPETGVFNPGNIWDTFLQVAATSAVLGTGHVASYGIGKGVEAWSNANRLRQTNKAGQAVFGVDSWDDVKQAVEGAVRGISEGADGIGLSEEGKAAMRGLMEGRSQDEKQAIVDYFGARVKSEVSSAMIADETMTDDERELQNDYSRGYEAMMQSYDEDSEDADQRSMLAASDMAIERDQKRTALAERIGEETVEELEQSRLGGSDIDDQLARMVDEGKIDEGDMEEVKDYMKAHAAYRGVEDFVNEAGDAVSRQARMEMAPTRDEQGNVRTATMKNGKTLYIKGGEVKVQKDGTIDTEGSTEALTAYDPEEEKNVFVNVDDIESMEEKGSDEVEREIEQRGNDFKEAMLNEINGVNTLGVGKEVTAENGMRGIVVAEDADNYILQMEDGQQVAVNKEQYEQELQARRMADYEQRHRPTPAEVEEEVREETPEGTETTEEVPSMEATEGAPEEYTPGMQLTLRDEDGNERQAAVLTDVRFELTNDGQFVESPEGRYIALSVEGEDGVVYKRDDILNKEVVRHEGEQPAEAERTEVPEEEIVEPKPIGTGAFGFIYNQFKGKAREAIAFLLRKRNGEAIGALHHKDIGDIDLVWGEEGTGKSDGYGLAKLAKYHPEVLENLQEILDDMHVTRRSENRVQLESDTHQATVRLEWDNEKKNWLLTAFEKKNSVLDNTTDTGKTPNGGKRNDTATPQNAVFAGKDTNISETGKENVENNSTAEDIYNKVKERYGANARNKIEVTVKDREKVAAERKKKLDTARKAFDDAPIGKEDKAEKELAKAQEAYEAAVADLDYWKAVKSVKDQEVLAESAEEDRRRKAAEEARRAEAMARYEEAKKREAEMRERQRAEAEESRKQQEEQREFEAVTANRIELEEGALQRSNRLAEASNLKQKKRIAREIYGERLGDLGEDSDQFDTDVMEYVAAHMPKNLRWEGNGGVQAELGSDKKRRIGVGSDTQYINKYLAPKGEGVSVDAAVHELWRSELNEKQDGNLEKRYTDDEIKGALLELLLHGEDIDGYVLNHRIEVAEEAMQGEESRVAMMIEEEWITAHDGMTKEEYYVWWKDLREKAAALNGESYDEYFNNLINEENDRTRETTDGRVPAERAGESVDDGRGGEESAGEGEGEEGERVGAVENGEGGNGGNDEQSAVSGQQSAGEIAVSEKAQQVKTATDVEAGGAVVDQLERMGVEVSTDIAENRRVRKQAEQDNSEAGQVHEMRTDEGKVYGFAYRGKLYLDPRKIDAELPLHEYSHLWTEAIKTINPQKWAEVVETIKQDKAAWDFIRETYPNLKSDSEIADEVIATFGGRNGAEKLKEALNQFTDKHPEYKTRWNAIYNSVVKAIQDFWRAVGDFLNIKYESPEQVYDQVLKDFAAGMNPRARVEKYLKERDNAYMKAAESGDVAKATEIFNQALSEEVGNGMTPFVAVGKYSDVRNLARKVKSREPQVIQQVAEMMAPMIPDNAVLVPAPSHSGRATDMLDLANAIAEIKGVPVADVLQSAPRESQFQTKKEGGLIESKDMGITMDGTVPEGKIPVVIDNVVDSGNTAEACVKALGKGLVVSLGDSADMYGHAVTLKSAAPILRGKDGKVVPLSKRFDLTGTKYLGRAMQQKAGEEALSAPTAEQAKVVKGLVKRLNDAGIPTHLVTRDGQKKLDEVRDRATRQNGGFGPTFYSNAEKAVEGIKQEKASAEQWLAMIQKAGGLKAGEDKWIGLSDWLNDHKGESLTKQQVLDYIRENQIQVEEVEYSDARMPGDFAYNLRNELNEKADDICGDVTDEYQNEIEEAEDFSEELDDLETEMIEEARRRLDDEFGVPTEDYISIQFENDRNRLVYTPTRSDRDFSNNFAQQVWNQRNGNEGRPINETRLQYTTDFLDNKREIALTIPSIEPWNENDEIHFGDAGGGRAVAWLRFGDAVDADGKKVLVIDEIQSNRHQEGREKGYKTKEAEAEEEKLVEAVEKAQEAYDDFTRRMGDKYNGAYEDIYADMTEAEQAEANRLEKEVSDADERLQNHNVPDVPDAPFEKNWHEVAMKRMLRYAAENGYDKVAWTKGEQQAERYDLSKEIREIKIRKDGRTTPEGEALYEVYTIDTNTGREVPAASGMFNATRLKETFGKDLASRLEKVAEESQTNGAWDGWGSIAGDGLRIGGEGMKGFYDQILPRFMDKYGKKWGVKTADIELPNIGDNGLTMHSVEVTPEMKQSVMSGQPMFHKVFHGSGADFERFDSSHMGEGEGAQAYGYGHYTTEVEGIGRMYAEDSGKAKYKGKSLYSDPYSDEPGDRALYYIEQEKGRDNAIKFLKDLIKEEDDAGVIKDYEEVIKALEDVDSWSEPTPHLYTVEIPDDNGSNYLEWDKPVSEEQLKRIEDGLLERGIPQDMVESIRKGLRYKQNRTGRYVYDRIADIILPTANNFKQASEFLHSIGFTGIKYPTQFRSGGREDGASNYVIFDENDLKITDKVKFYLSPDGEVIGYTVDGEIWIDPRYAKPDTPVHEYTHLWADGIERSNPKAFKQLVDEMRKETELWDYVRGRYPEIKNESELAKEVFAHYSGKRGRERLEKEMRAEMAKADGMVEKAKVANVFHKLRELLDKFWNMARDLFAGKVEGIENLKAEDFADMALNDLLRGFDPVRARAEQMDKEYMEAVEKGDMETAQRMVDAEARRKGYISDNEYRMNHTAPSGRDGFSKSIDNPTEIYPEDLYSPQGYHYYGDGNRAMDIESWNVFKRLHGNPDAMVTIYRAVPKSVQESKLRNGDWVTINKSYAQEHGERNINGAYKIIEDVVPAKYVFTDGNSLHEQGYDDGKEYAYKNTKNNRKLLDAVTYDDNGNVIPLSERFNKRNADIRFQKANTIDPRMMSIEERQRRGDMLRNTPAIDVEQGQITKTENKSARKAAEEWWDNNVGEPKAYDTEVGDVVIDRKSVESSLAHRYSQMKLDAITSLVDGFNNAVYLGSMPDAERRATQNHYFAYPINYNRERCYVFCRALHDNNTNRLHVHEVFVENNIKKGDTLQTAALKPHGGITLYRDILANVLDISAAKVQQNSETAKNNLQEGESENDISVVTRIGEGPQVTYTPYDEALKSAKKAGYTKAQFDRHIERVWNQRKKTAERFAEKLNLGDRVNVVLDIDELEGMNLTDRQKRAKGWYDTKTGKIYVIMDNNTGMDDVFQTILHEGVAHHGLRELFGENFDTFLDDVYAHSTEDIRREIASLSKKYNWNVRTATEEYMAKMAETQNFEHPQYESWWRMVKDWFIAMVKMIGMGDWIGNHTITENELRFVLWRSWKNLTEPEGNWGYVRQAQDIAMQAELGVGEYADKAPYGRDWKVEKPREEVPVAASGDVKYDELKAQVPDKVIMMKNGELYEIKGEDAKTAAQLLGLPTGEDGVLRIPEDMMEKSLSKLVNSGKKVAIAEPIAENKVAEDGIMLRDGEEELEGKEEDIWKDKTIGMQERLTAAKLRMAEQNKESLATVNEAVKAVGGNLYSLRIAMNLQKMYDRQTVKSVSDLARIMMQYGYMDDMKKGEVKRLLSAVKNATGKTDVTKEINTVMDIMIDNTLRRAETMLKALEKVKASKVDAKGVEVQGKLDVQGQEAMRVFKESRNMREDQLSEAMAETFDQMESDNKAIVDAAVNRYIGLKLAQEYAQSIKESIENEHDLKEAIRKEKLEVKPDKEYIASLEDAIRQNKAERVEAYAAFTGRLTKVLAQSIEGAKSFVEAEKEKVREIRHYANSDMEGKADNEHHKQDNWLKKTNNLATATILAPMRSFSEMMKLFGSKSSNGEGYLYNHFVRGFIDARQKEVRGVRGKYAILDAKAKEIFGNGVKGWADMMNYIALHPKRFPTVTLEWKDGSKRIGHKVSQGNLMYIYMVNKMTDGRMKLRKMGITDEMISKVTRQLDPRLIEMADWLQGEFLVETRNEYNETHKRIFGASMAAIEDYFTLVINEGSRHKDSEKEDEKGGADASISTKTGAIIKRKANTTPLDLLNADAMQVVLKHVTDMEHWNAFAEYNRDLNILRSYNRFENRVKNMNTVYGSGDKLWKRFNELCQVTTGTYKPKQNETDQASLKFAQGVTAAKVAFRINTALKQLLSAPAYLPYVNAAGFYKALASDIVNKETTFKWCLEHLPLFEERWKSRVAGDPKLAKSVLDWQNMHANALAKIGRIGMFPNALVDAMTVSIGAHAVYETRKAQYLKEGYSEEQAERRAIQDAEIAYNETQQSSEGAFISTVQADRSWWTVMFTIFRNASMAYTRQLWGAMRNLKNNVTPKQRRQTKEFMAKQMEREGVPADKAEAAAKKRFRKDMRKNYISLATFGYIVQFAWNFGNNMWYLLLGDDDDKKKDIWKDIFVQSMFGGLEGLIPGDLISEYGRQIVRNDYNPSKLNKDMPISSDLVFAIQKYAKGKKDEALYDMFNLAVQMGLGVNPQTISDFVLSFTDICGGDIKLAHEAMIWAARFVSAPPSQIREIYFDEIGMTGEEATKFTPQQLAERYARYQVKRGRLIEPWTWGDEEAYEKEMKKANKEIKERVEKFGGEEVNEAYEAIETEVAPMAERVKAANKATKSDYVEGAKMWDKIWAEEDAYMKYKDFKDMDKNLDELVKAYLQSETPEDAVKYQKAIGDYKKAMVEAMQAYGTSDYDALADKASNLYYEARPEEE